MIRNYFLVAFRNISRTKLFSLINVIGLSLGITAAIVLGLFASYELSYDQFHEKTENIYLVYKERITPAGVQPTYDTWMPLAPQMKLDFPEVEQAMRVSEASALVEIEGNRFNEQCYYVDPEYFSLFDFSLQQGTAESLRDDKAVLISRRLAKKYFGSEDPLGKVIRVDFTRDYRVAGILGDFPRNTFFSSELIFPIRSIPGFKEEETNWNSSSYYTFVLLGKDARMTGLLEKFPAFIKKIWDEETQKRTTFKLLPLKSSFETFVGNPQDVYILLMVGIGLVVIAGINFVNLTTARSLDRSKEVSMRKVFGAQRSQLVNQFLLESVLMSVGAMLVSVGASRLLLPFVNSQYNLDLQLRVDDPGIWLGLLAFSGLLGLLAGSFPSLVMSGMRIQRGLKSFESGKSHLRNGLVVLQFALSMILVVTMMTIGKQVSFMKTADLGFRSKGQIVVPISSDDFPDAEQAQQRLQTFKDIISENANVQSLTSSRHIPTQWSGSNTFVKPEGWQDDPLRMRFTYHDADFLKTYEIPLLEGDGFKDDSFGDQRESAVINQAALRAFGWQNVNEKFLLFGERKVAVVGLIPDFNYETLREEVAPIIHFHRQASNRTHRYITVKVSDGKEQGVVDYIRSKWNLLDETGLLPFNYFFLEDNIGTMYQAEDRLFTMIRIFSGIILAVACMGLFGLSSFSLDKRKKEIGIRKILGATVPGIVSMFFRRYLALIMVSFLIALPISYYLMEKWLSGYARHTSIGMTTFLLALVSISVVALFTVSSKTVVVALQNPVKAIREE